MDCIDSTTDATATDLLTQADKIARLEAVFSKHRHKTDIFLPDETFYTEVCGPDEITRMADILFKWLGIKHRSARFHIDPTQEKLISYKKEASGSNITLGWRCEQDGFLAAAAVAHGIVHHILLSRQKLNLGSSEETEELTDLGTIHAGFGILVLNSLGSAQGALGSLAPPNYISEFFDYLTAERVVESLWSPYILPDVMQAHISTVRPVRRQSFVQKRFTLLQRTRNRRRLAAGTFVVCFVAVGFLALSRPKAQSAEQFERYDGIRVLKNQVEQCEETVRRKLATWDQEDIFMQRQIEADKTRCSSLRSRYNYEVSQYNENL